MWRHVVAVAVALRARTLTRTRWPRAPLLLLTPLLLAVAAISTHAADGVFEINQVCAINTGCFTGDAPGWPVTIGSRGSYRLTGNIGFNSVLGPPSADLIEISGSDVQLDLGGFGLRCASVLTGSPCRGTGIAGIRLASQTERVRIRNGTVYGMPGSGISASLSDRIQVRDLIVSSSGSTGIHTGDTAQVESCTVIESGVDGIRVGDSSRVASSTVRQSGRYGILADEGSTLIDNIVRDIGTTGISTGFSSVVRGNNVRDAGGTGIETGGSSVVENNTSSDNTIGFDLTGLYGLARGNVSAANSSFGMRFGIDWVFRENSVASNNGSSTSGGLDGGGNFCGGTPGCP